MIDQRTLAAIQALRARDRVLAGVCRDLAAENRWLRDRLLELHQRVKALDGITPVNVPPWPPLDIPPELRELLTPEN